MANAKRAERKRAGCGWYVVQVTPGSERRMCAAIERSCEELDGGAGGGPRIRLEECFCPRYASRKKRMGNWHDTTRMLLPGYVIAVVRNPARLALALRGLGDFARVLSSSDEKAYSPLDEAEREWLESQTVPGERIVPMSFAVKEGAKVVVTDGPLAGNEAMITRIDRKNCIAHVEFHAGTMTLRTTVGLAIMPSGVVRQT